VFGEPDKRGVSLSGYYVDGNPGEVRRQKGKGVVPYPKEMPERKGGPSGDE
jgi:hypothetical protein